MSLLPARGLLHQLTLLTGTWTIRFVGWAVAACLAAAAYAAPPADKKVAASDDPALRLHSILPLGAESFDLSGPSKGMLLTLMASAENPAFDGLIREKQGQRYVLHTSAGELFQYFPDNIDFRVTASLRTKLFDPSPFPVSIRGDPNNYLLALQFRVIVFRGLHTTVLKPENVALIGVPADVASDERIFRISVALPHIPTDDRIVLEVLSPSGERICKFHLDLT